MLTLKTNTMKYKNADGVMQDVGAIIGEKTTDASLSQAGFPADAKAVGEKFSQLSDTINCYYVFNTHQNPIKKRGENYSPLSDKYCSSAFFATQDIDLSSF